LIEIDVSHLPDLVIETARVPMRSGFGVVGRIDGGAFAVTAGTIEPWCWMHNEKAYANVRSRLALD